MAGLVPSGGSEGGSIHCLCQLLAAADNPWLRGGGTTLQSLPPFLYHLLFCVCLIPVVRMLLVAFRTYLDNPRLSHLKILNIVVSAKALFPNEEIRMWTYLLEASISPSDRYQR